MSQFFDDHTIAVTAQLLARMVEESVAIGRAHGFAYPADYTVGVRLLERGHRTHLRLRLDTFTHETSINTPLHDDADELIVALQRVVTEAVMRWVDAVPGIKPNTEAARNVIRAMGVPGWREGVLDRARTQAKAAHFKVVR